MFTDEDMLRAALAGTLEWHEPDSLRGMEVGCGHFTIDGERVVGRLWFSDYQYERKGALIVMPEERCSGRVYVTPAGAAKLGIDLGAGV